ncbi:hypothetical protein A3B48_04670 [Candidatus Gottesmanbacteria bacterium RIFCSPLOWO2_01_FULL_40_10]|nr:MAG: hypothetical protein A3B48_04670 [Candidatus Gottesmanbacteria bacterium RIFCSPLOWO2_01_FULL_40_10]
MSLGSFKKQVKYILLIAVSLLIFVATVILGKQASVYFASASECPAKNIRTESVGPNSSVIAWDTDDRTQGRVEYGTNAVSLTFTSPEAQSKTNHTVPLTLLTPNTVYYYLVAVGETRCDSTGQKCEGDCVPYSFTTSSLTKQGDNEEEDVTPTQRTMPSVTVPAASAQPTSSLSLFCKAVQANIGKNETVESEWSSLKTYDIDSNGIINGLDVIKCQKSGK